MPFSVPSVHRLGCWPAGRSSCLSPWVIAAWLLFSRAGFPCLLVVYLLGCSLRVFLGTHNVKLEFNLRVTIKLSFPAFAVMWYLLIAWEGLDTAISPLPNLHNPRPKEIGIIISKRF